jgi:hypothetical protein
MHKHTPGPWKIDDCGYVTAPQPDVAGEGEELPPEYEVASVGNGSPHLTPRELADARLIAAAPDLLAACKLWDEGLEVGMNIELEALLEWMNANRRATRDAVVRATVKR